MAQQERAIRTRRMILEAAAAVYDMRGFQAATITEILREAGVTKGALYFHFDSKEDLARGVLAEQNRLRPVPPRECKTQELTDLVMVFGHRLRTDPLVRASVRLTLDHQARGLDRTGPFVEWSGLVLAVLTAAKERGELLPTADLASSADLFVGAFAGVQAMSQVISDYEDIDDRVQALLRGLLPSVVVPSVLACLDLNRDRGARVAAEIGVGD